MCLFITGFVFAFATRQMCGGITSFNVDPVWRNKRSPREDRGKSQPNENLFTSWLPSVRISCSKPLMYFNCYPSFWPTAFFCSQIFQETLCSTNISSTLSLFRYVPAIHPSASSIFSFFFFYRVFLDYFISGSLFFSSFIFSLYFFGLSFLLFFLLVSPHSPSDSLLHFLRICLFFFPSFSLIFSCIFLYINRYQGISSFPSFLSCFSRFSRFSGISLEVSSTFLFGFCFIVFSFSPFLSFCRLSFHYYGGQ